MKRPASIPELTDLVLKFRHDRDWKQFHNPKDMALSLALEAAEVLELMQWKNGQELLDHLRDKHARLGEELADVMFWVLAMANDFQIDIAEAFRQKIATNQQKYPVHKARGVSTKYTEL